MKDKGSQAGWGFWLGWVLATTVGMLVGAFMGVVAGFLMYGLFGDEGVVEWLGDMVMVIIFGIGIGTMQWLVLRRRITGAGWWILASAVAGAVIQQGDIVSFDKSLSFGDLMRYTLVMALGGAVAGILQWLVLRTQVFRAGWWVLASTVGWGLSMTMWGAGMVLQYVWGDSGTLIMVGGGPVLGAITGVALVWLLRQPVPEA
jgi:hypothetical protein